jgi:hypothetical protein
VAENSAKTAPGTPFEKGKSGNPGGRPRIPDEVKQVFEAKTLRTVERLFELMESDNEKVAMRAVEVALDRQLGKVTDKLELSADESFADALKKARERAQRR